MALAQANECLLGVLDFLTRNMGLSTLTVRFEDVGLPRYLEPYFDGMVRWAERETLLTLADSRGLYGANSDQSFAVLINPAITTLGISAANTAIDSLDGNVVLAAALLRHRVPQWTPADGRQAA